MEEREEAIYYYLFCTFAFGKNALDSSMYLKKKTFRKFLGHKRNKNVIFEVDFTAN